jgi:hypothetical protein
MAMVPHARRYPGAACPKAMVERTKTMAQRNILVT